jgi:hypothetical protein
MKKRDIFAVEESNETLRAYVRLTPNSGARADIPRPPLWANSRPARCRINIKDDLIVAAMHQ